MPPERLLDQYCDVRSIKFRMAHSLVTNDCRGISLHNNPPRVLLDSCQAGQISTLRSFSLFISFVEVVTPFRLLNLRTPFR
jgi:hypothetical protein